MRIAILSDIHGNLEALKATLADLDARAPDTVVSLGDMVGYGPDPEAVVQTLASRGIESLKGNHELGLSNARARAWFNPPARRALEITGALLSPSSMEYLAQLPLFISLGSCRLVHGFPPDSPRRYLFEADDDDISLAMEVIAEPVCFVGHSHKLALVRVGESVEHLPLSEGVTQLDPEAAYLVNAGAVGQPRDGDTRAGYVIFDHEALTVEVRRLEYDYHATARKILERGIDEIYARRLGWAP